VKFGLAYNTAYYGTDPDLMVAVARHAEERGFESFYTAEHIVIASARASPGWLSAPPPGT
jgi:alkanesulfonate monooxygenase SsuD/methylene tetrahydromethanopterin reductase-like flavin-dependent oxidoreductase (luciferase family)